MATFLVYTHPDTSKIDHFNGKFFKRWQERVYYAIDVVNLGHILTNPKPKNDYEDLSKWENGNKQVRHVILSTLTNELFDVYCQCKVSKEIWDALTTNIHSRRCWNTKICHMKFWKVPND